MFDGFYKQNITGLTLRKFKTLSRHEKQIDSSMYDEIDEIYDYIKGTRSLPRNISFNDDRDQQELKNYPSFKYEQDNTSISFRQKEKLLVNQQFSESDLWKCDDTSIKDGFFQNKRENCLFQLSRQVRPIPISIKTLPSRLKHPFARRTALFNGITNISTGQKVSTSLNDCHQNIINDIR